MSLCIASLNSGSNGNAYYAGHEEAGILIDAGLSCRETERRMRQLGLDIGKLKAILISHEHGDHIRGLAVLAERYDLPVYLSAKTAIYCRDLQPSRVNIIADASVFDVAGFTVHPFSKQHDAAEPLSFRLESRGLQVGIFTDIGKPCDKLIAHFAQCHAAFLEANYDEEMLENGPYTYHLKQRIRGGEGHLSNLQALDLYRQYSHPNLRHLFLAHLSEKNNHPEKLMQMFGPYTSGRDNRIASRFEAGCLVTLGEGSEAVPQKTKACSTQLPLFY